MSGYDIIGDVHGQADKLHSLLAILGYQEELGVYRHASRQAVFVGDLIDRGPKIQEVLETARKMVDDGAALAVMGNHELNAILFHTRDASGKPLRAHTPEKVRQHAATLEQVVTKSADTWSDWLEWFKTLPFFLELGGLRIVHACWDQIAVDLVANRTLRDREFLLEVGANQTPAAGALDLLLKGPELNLPAGAKWHDKDGHERTTMRTRWYAKPDPNVEYSYRDLALPSLDCLPDTLADPSFCNAIEGYSPEAVPVLFGHYWLPPGRPALLASNVACLDYSAGKDGPLVAYRWDGERILNQDKFVPSAAI
ncbi:MAG: metallophosphoesterase [Verrucomicrobiota bacterium]|nr:metallophosphoesterase [Verrucomicrobiota bacterium]